jgi:broad specificity phosphatase PhoE
MERAKDTARAISEKTGKAVDYSELFVERIWPSWFIGLSHNDPRVVEAEKEMIENFTVSGYRRDDGENFEDLKKRAILALQHIKERKEENIVVVTHGMFLRVMLAAVIYGSDLSAHECDRMLGGMITKNTGVSVIKESDKWISGWHLYVYNDHAHLAE